MPRRTITMLENGKWFPWERKEQWICCDCDLVHEVEYRWRKGKLEVKMDRNERSTSAYRRKQKNGT